MAEIIAKRYEIIKSIGHGGMADVYLAIDKILNREVAIKVMKADISSDPVSLQRFRMEANASCNLSHPNIVDIYDVGDDGDKHYIVMEYVKGHTLKQLIKHRGAIAPKEAVWLMKQLALALLEAHKKGLIHRDIKSQNVLIKNDGTVKLADFGIAILNNAMQLTSKDSVLGSVHYLAPELAKGGSASMKSDIYSLGIVFYEVLAGEVPFKGETPVQIALKHVKEDLPNLKKFNPNIPQSVINVILKATAKDPNNRYDNVALMLRDLNMCLDKDKLNCRPLTFNNKIENKPKNYQIPKSDIKEEVIKKNEKTQNKFSIILLVLISTLSIMTVLLILFITGTFNRTDNKYVTIPDVIEDSLSTAKDKLDNLDISYTYPIKWEYNDEIEKGCVIEITPNVGSKIEKGKKVTIVVSNGSYPVIENYIGKNINDLKKQLNNDDIKYSITEIDGEGEPGTIISQSLEAGSSYNPELGISIEFEVIKNNSYRIPNNLLGKNIDEVYNQLVEMGIKNVSKHLVSKSELTAGEIYLYNSNCLARIVPGENETFVDDGETTLELYYYQGE